MSVRLLSNVPVHSLALFALCAATPLVAASPVAEEVRTLPDIGAPAGGKAAWIARAMRLNGVPMTIKSFTAATNAAEVLHQYERRLRRSADMKTRRARHGSWHVLGVMTTEYYATIRTRDTPQGTEGVIIVTPPLADVKPMKRTRFPLPESTTVVSLQEYDDAGVEAEHITLASPRSVVLEARAFTAQLSRHGWQLLRSEATKAGDGHVIEAQRAAALAFITLRRAEQGGSTILVVWRKA